MIDTVQAVAVAESADEADDVAGATAKDYRHVDSDRSATGRTTSALVRVIAGAIVLAFFATLILAFTEALK